MNGFNKENNILKTLNLFNQMKLDGFVLDLIAYLCVLKALSKIGDESICQINCYGVSEMSIQAIELYRLVDGARSIFKNIQIKPEQIYDTMINCLSRASFFDETQELIDEYECYHSPVSTMYFEKRFRLDVQSIFL
ncbi:unnamed protein product [Rotaria sordida]|uniref:Uncharacterized protein n=1 Tax=Rotaria sordida TaxID=392033 RepID=A0A813MTL9_9BILA|nr:unnamed protein product [Rotaria sordida]